MPNIADLVTETGVRQAVLVDHCATCNSFNDNGCPYWVAYVYVGTDSSREYTIDLGETKSISDGDLIILEATDTFDLCGPNIGQFQVWKLIEE